ncbi:MAG: DNA-binding NtrC family response regulator [Candidatus Paceibacteria bacterium]|jgi:DNA-binding NtrC family response regulator
MAHLLIVDNDERIVELTVWFLRRLGHEVDSAPSYAEARGQIRSRRPDLLLADLDLGTESGLEELPKLALEGLLPPTLVVSGFLDAKLETELRRIPGVLDTLSKPVDLTSLEAAIERCIEEARGLLIPHVPTVPEVQAPAADEPKTGLSQEEEDDGWVEIAPLAADVQPAPATSVPWNLGEQSR